MKRLQRTEHSVNFFFGIFANGTGVENHQIGFAGVICETVSDFAQYTGDFFAVVFVLLTAESVYKCKRLSF